jgi:hypothetical protein
VSPDRGGRSDANPVAATTEKHSRRAPSAAARTLTAGFISTPITFVLFCFANDPELILPALNALAIFCILMGKAQASTWRRVTPGLLWKK